MKLVRLSSWGMCAVVLAFFVTASTPPRGTQSVARPLDGRPNASTQPVAHDEWARIGEWMRANHCAVRYESVDHLPDSPVKEHLELLIAERFHMIERVKDSDIRKALIEQVQAQDRIFALQIAYRRNRKGAKPIAEMKSAVQDLLHAEAAERNARAARLRSEADQLQAKANDPTFITHVAQAYINTADKARALRPPGEPGPPSEGESHAADVRH